MALELEVISGPKGSNPGGKCIAPSFKRGICYLKYCHVNEVPFFGLDVQNQPIYEAISLEMAKRLGLSVPDYGVIVNSNKTDVRFSYSPKDGKKISPLNPKKSFYFLSLFIPHNVDDTNKGLPSLMAREKIFRDLLNLGDISGRAQNYSFIQLPDGSDPFVTYIDVGCGLVDAHGGRLNIRTSLKNKLKKMKSKKNLRNIKNKLSRWEIETSNGKKVNLGKFGESISEIPISVIDASKRRRVDSLPASTFLSLEELNQLQMIYFVVNEKFLKKYSCDNRLSRVRR